MVTSVDHRHIIACLAVGASAIKMEVGNKGGLIEMMIKADVTTVPLEKLFMWKVLYNLEVEYDKQKQKVYLLLAEITEEEAQQ